MLRMPRHGFKRQPQRLVTHVAPRAAHRLEFDTDLSQLLHYYLNTARSRRFLTANIYRTGKAVERCTKVRYVITMGMETKMEA